MPREIPKCPDKPSPKREADRSFEIELITPMFGGGAEPSINDPTFPIRPTSIRGQLQFWWRATVGARYSDLADLRAAHTKVWGSTKQASPVEVLVNIRQVESPAPCANIEWNQNARQGKGAWRVNWQAPFNGRDSALPYVLFPFQGETPPPNRNATITAPPASCILNANFELIIRCPSDIWEEVEPALWAWVNFGGLGGRTRRGCGAIFCAKLAPKDKNHFAKQLKQFSHLQSETRGWPTIGECVLVRTADPPGHPIPVWDWVIGLFRHFRQGKGFARNRGREANRPGRSRWPEPETIRELLGADRERSGHQRLPEIVADAFPRAELGLPIIYELRGDGEPPKTSLQPIVDHKPCDRMASPLILKPLALLSGQALPLIANLVAPRVNEVVLMQGKIGRARLNSSHITRSRMPSSA
jgi:CRISPR-associated protein Cmr1